VKPVLAFRIHPEVPLDPEYVADLINMAMDREFGRGGVPEVVSVRLLSTEEELRSYMAGDLVLYRKPARRQGNVIEFERDGVRHRLEQTTAFGDNSSDPV
jgi:hypothetical protein